MNTMKVTYLKMMAVLVLAKELGSMKSGTLTNYLMKIDVDQ